MAVTYRPVLLESCSAPSAHVNKHAGCFLYLSSVGLHETLALLTSQLRPDANHKEDMVFLKDVFSERSLGCLMKIHEKLRQYERQSPTPVLYSASSLAEDVAEELHSGPMSTEEKELLHLLTSPHLKAVLSVHDTVRRRTLNPVLPPLDDETGDPRVLSTISYYLSALQGATIRRDEATGVVIVARIMRGGAADRSGLVHVGDELREVNGVSVIHKRPDEISQLLSQSQGSITLKIIPAIKEEDRLKDSKVYMRALFDYVPLEDKATPCQEAGLPFKRGDILQVVTQDDHTWWQAKRVGDSLFTLCLPPVFPACLPTEDCDCEGYFNGQYIAGLRRSFRLSRKDRQGSSGEGSDPGDSDYLTYEEVTRYQQRPNERPRLVVLIGSLGARINELKQRVIAENPHRFAVAVPHTTRPKKPHEKEGVEYHFVTKQQFDADALNNKFIEHGEYKENQYGTSIEAIRSVQAKNKMCVVDVQPEALRRLRTAEFKPYVIFVKPRVPESRRRQPLTPFEDEDLQEMRQSAAQIDQQYGHLVDRILVKEDSASACAELRGILERLERESFWVPLSWVRT
uniref:MAGUK p55 scaffold protein 3a n=1 Tax=Gasterosteus aculeatus aculeatus TaxID=481459 RepID=G3P4R6_GASAC